jgi:hypothetical protein
MLKREDILKADDLPFEDVDVPEWGGTVRVRALMASERDRWEAMTYLDSKGNVTTPQDIRAKLVAFCCVDEEGNRLFTEDDISALAKKSARAMNRLWTVASRLSAVIASDIDALTKN